MIVSNIKMAQTELEQRGLAWHQVDRGLTQIATKGILEDYSATCAYITGAYGEHRLIQVGYTTYRYQSDPSAAGWQSVCRVAKELDWHAYPEERHMILHHVAGHPFVKSIDVNGRIYTYRLNPDGTEQVSFNDLAVHPHEAHQVFTVLAGGHCPPDQRLTPNAYNPLLRRVEGGGWEADSKSSPGTTHQITYTADWRGVNFHCTCFGHQAYRLRRSAKRSDCWHVKEATRLSATDERVQAEVKRAERHYALPISPPRKRGRSKMFK